MDGYSVNRYNIESKKVHKSNQKGHLTLKYRKELNIKNIPNKSTKDHEKNSIKDNLENQNIVSALASKEDLIDSKHISKNEIINNDKIEYNNEDINEDIYEDNSEDELVMKKDNIFEEELDEDKELLLELEKIKKERAEKERENKNNEIKLKLQSNPLLDEEELDKNYDINSYVLKKRWTDDTVFRNKCKIKEKKKRFINDILHSDHHKEFMKKYIL